METDRAMTGVSPEHEWERLGFDELCDRLEIPMKTLLLMHTSPDADTLGSCLALSSLLSAADSTVYCACADPMPEHLHFLSDGQKCLDIPAGFVPDRVIAVDVASPSQLGALREKYEGKVSLMIDHHGMGTPFADHFVDPDAAATGEIIFDIAKEFLHDGIICRVPEVFWTYCYAAIAGDTGGFRFSNTTPATMRRAAVLLEHGVDAAQISDRLFCQRSLSQLRAECIGCDRMTLFMGGRLAIMTMPYEVIAENGFRDGDLGTLIDVARSVRGVEVAAVVKQLTAEKKFRASLRSSVDFDVAEVAAEFGGGGHTRAAGCTILAGSMDEAAEKLQNAITARFE